MKADRLALAARDSIAGTGNDGTPMFAGRKKPAMNKRGTHSKESGTSLLTGLSFWQDVSAVLFILLISTVLWACGRSREWPQ